MTDWERRAGDDHHEQCDSDYWSGESDFELEEEPFVDVDHYITCGHRLRCKRCGGIDFTVVIVQHGYWTGALCERCGILESIHEG